MRELQIGEKTVRVRATPLALLYYRQEFKSDLLGDMTKMKGVESDPSKFDAILLLQITWSMAKADAGPGSKFPGFEAWLNSLDGANIMDPGFFAVAMEEAADGFFRRGKQQKQGQRNQGYTKRNHRR